MKQRPTDLPDSRGAEPRPISRRQAIGLGAGALAAASLGLGGRGFAAPVGARRGRTT